MSIKHLLTLVTTALGGLVLLLAFNNCQPIDSDSTESAADAASVGSSSSKGSVSIVNETGYVRGWAQDPENPDVNLKVMFYLDGPPNSGELAGYTVADKTGGSYNGHYFEFNIPSSLIDNQQHTLYVYIDAPSGPILLAGTPRSYVAFSPSQAGRDFYNSNVVNKMGACMNCHTVNYDVHFGQLMSPNIFSGGSANSNNLINNASGQSHGGGSHCTSKTSGLCAELQQWWNIEFGD